MTPPLHCFHLVDPLCLTPVLLEGLRWRAGHAVVCSGTERHELTPWMSFNSIFRFFNEVLELKEDDKAEGPFSAVTTRSGSLKPNHQNL
ncbi:Protein FAM172A [Takifugu flavidus]|uniref:Protein FAM172A n=1 Tax=Takifugu flavidus TaxID=433684 RepID=A0A5C6MZZ4_9TELE|nr:Protein FAM172A [Takifugu flavidus]